MPGKSLCIVSARDYARYWATEDPRMRNRCEASGLRVRAVLPGHGRCPLCDVEHALTARGKLRPHARTTNRSLTPHQIEERLERAQREAEQ
jgi:hypothetical protein